MIQASRIYAIESGRMQFPPVQIGSHGIQPFNLRSYVTTVSPVPLFYIYIYIFSIARKEKTKSNFVFANLRKQCSFRQIFTPLPLMARNVLAEASEHIIEGGNREAPAPPKEQSKHRESIRGVAMAPSVISAARASRSTILTLRPRCDAYSHRFSIVWHILLSPFVSYIGKAMDRNRLFNQDLVPDMFCLQFGISDR